MMTRVSHVTHTVAVVGGARGVRVVFLLCVLRLRGAAACVCDITVMLSPCGYCHTQKVTPLCCWLQTGIGTPPSPATRVNSKDQEKASRL